MKEHIYRRERANPIAWLVAFLLTIFAIAVFYAGTTQPTQAACEQFTLVYGPKEIKSTPPVDKWGHQINPPASLSQTVGDSKIVTGFAYSKDTIDDPATPEVEKPGEACTP